MLAPIGTRPSFSELELEYDGQGTRVKRILHKGGAEETTLYVAPHYEKRPETKDGTTSLYDAFGRVFAERIHSWGIGQEETRYLLERLPERFSAE